jgi:hypothetical protein
MPPTAAAQLQYAVKPGQPVSWRSTPTMNPPLAKHKCLLTSVFRGPLSGCLQDMVRRGRYSPVAALRRATSCPGTLSAAPLSHTRRRQRGPGHATRRSWATFYFPQNYFVWENKKIDSRPYNAGAHTHQAAGSPPRTLARTPAPYRVAGLPCTRRDQRHTFQTFPRDFRTVSSRLPPPGPSSSPGILPGSPPTLYPARPGRAAARRPAEPRCLPWSPASAVQGSRATYPGAPPHARRATQPYARSTSPTSPTGRRAH